MALQTAIKQHVFFIYLFIYLHDFSAHKFILSDFRHFAIATDDARNLVFAARAISVA